MKKRPVKNWRHHLRFDEWAREKLEAMAYDRSLSVANVIRSIALKAIEREGKEWIVKSADTAEGHPVKEWRFSMRNDDSIQSVLDAVATHNRVPVAVILRDIVVHELKRGKK